MRGASDPCVDATRTELDTFAGSELGGKYPTTVKTFQDAWERIFAFLVFAPELRRVIYTTNSIKSLNYQLRKLTKNGSHFPNDETAIKMLWLAICNIEDKRARGGAKELGGNRQTKCKAEGRLVEGQIVMNWKLALSHLAPVYPDRIIPRL